MASIAVVIAVSNYGGPPNDLAACAQDGLAIKELLEASGRFNRILYVHDNTTSTVVKTQLAEFIKAHHNQEIDEVLFYFTGHGEFIAGTGELYYLLSDYNSRHKRSTSLENSEVDDLVRPLNPKLFVKIVDACNSGKTYIKSRDEIDEYLKSAHAKFSKLYFMFSSQSDQYSSASEKISFFTESILKSIYAHCAETIRYADVISYVSDDFSADRAQTPLFVTQADFTETFLPITPEVRAIVGRYIDAGTPEDGAEDTKEAGVPLNEVEIKVIDKIRDDAKMFCSREEAQQILRELPNHFDRPFLSEDIAEIYVRELSAINSRPENARQIGGWIDKNKDVSNYFALPTFSQEAYKRRINNPILSLSATLRGDPSGDTYVDAVRTVVDGYKITTEQPYTYFALYLKSSLPNVPMEACFVAPILSRTHIRIFWSYAHFKYTDWDQQNLASNVEWITDDALLKDDARIETLASKILDGFKAFVEEPLRAAWEA
ncbi:caspase family protein [Methylobacterium fujisawaense]|uniref:caspase family protein n=1 Tax=Methylobacterium fujisawaense TaxID=107400 RepID=UPI002446CEE2|nr:caspase family protein [Methylobacterium fujisawaense]MDH3031452.1 caspase family protein [Methylobacterium fujisawaense]